MKKLIFFIAAILIFNLPAAAQTKRINTAPKLPIIEIEATTKDGKAVILKSDKTKNAD